QITIGFALRSVFYKQRSRNFFRTVSYTIAESIVQVPVNLCASLLMCTFFHSCIFNLFSGFLLPYPMMADWYKWIVYVVPSSYSLRSLAVSQVGICVTNSDGTKTGNACMPLVGQAGYTGTVADWVQEQFDFRPDNRYNYMLVLIGMWVILQTCIYLTLKYVSHLKR
ncbi:hypothetical protein DYB32_010706, partial [Aphanomyces invadans]